MQWPVLDPVDPWLWYMRLSLILSRLQLTYALVLHSGQTWYWYTQHLAEVGWQ